MKYDGARLRSILAAQYVLGTLGGRARRRWERLAAADPQALRQQRLWEARFAHLGLRLAPVAPREVVWTALDRAINAAPATAARAPRVGLWRAWAVAATLASVALALALLRERGREPQVVRETEVVRVEVPVAQPAPLVAVLQPAGSEARWQVSLSPERGLIKVAMHGNFALGEQEALELWYLDEAGTPHSLGLLPHEAGEAAMPMPKDASMPAAPTLAISREPGGGSPTGLPTGPVIVAAPALRAA